MCNLFVYKYFLCVFLNQAADIIAVCTSLLDTLPAVTTPTESKLHASKEAIFGLVCL
jgi:hypothetical protein